MVSICLILVEYVFIIIMGFYVIGDKCNNVVVIFNYNMKWLLIGVSGVVFVVF